MKVDAVKISQNFLDCIRGNTPMNTCLCDLEKITYNALEIDLNSESKKKAFWINLYNAFSLHKLKENPKVILSISGRKSHFNKKIISIANHKLSLNDIEHGLIRNSRIWWAKGFFKKIFVSNFEKKFRVNVLDERIHFALNCGGKGCPPIRHYDPEEMDDQLDIATKAFLYSEAEYDSNENKAKVSQIFNWYSGDFGGRKGVEKFLKKYKSIPQKSNPKIIYNPYDWTPIFESVS